MSWKTIRTQVSDLLATNTKLVEVSSYPKLVFSGYPSAYVVPSDQESDYETTTENERIYSFLVRIFYSTKNGVGIENAMIAMEDVVDDIIDLIDQEDKKTSGRTIAVGLPSDYTFLSIEATPSLWGQIPGEELLMSELRIRIHVSFDAS